MSSCQHFDKRLAFNWVLFKQKGEKSLAERLRGSVGKWEGTEREWEAGCDQWETNEADFSQRDEWPFNICEECALCLELRPRVNSKAWSCGAAREEEYNYRFLLLMALTIVTDSRLGQAHDKMAFQIIWRDVLCADRTFDTCEHTEKR